MSSKKQVSKGSNTNQQHITNARDAIGCCFNWRNVKAVIFSRTQVLPSFRPHMKRNSSVFDRKRPVSLFSMWRGLGSCWERMKERNCCFYPYSQRHGLKEKVFFFSSVFLRMVAALFAWWMQWLRSRKKPEKSLMSRRIICAYESSSHYAQIPFHSGKKMNICCKRREEDT